MKSIVRLASILIIGIVIISLVAINVCWVNIINGVDKAELFVVFFSLIACGSFLYFILFANLISINKHGQAFTFRSIAKGKRTYSFTEIHQFIIWYQGSMTKAIAKKLSFKTVDGKTNIVTGIETQNLADVEEFCINTFIEPDKREFWIDCSLWIEKQMRFLYTAYAIATFVILCIVGYFMLITKRDSFQEEGVILSVFLAFTLWLLYRLILVRKRIKRLKHISTFLAHS
ncbi:MAG TPA: hypothetical protein PL009_09720 [Flavipsychrobacter sp.]|nr:hypothetical protein [Flavipsychrobacter sp.]